MKSRRIDADCSEDSPRQARALAARGFAAPSLSGDFAPNRSRGQLTPAGFAVARPSASEAGWATRSASSARARRSLLLILRLHLCSSHFRAGGGVERGGVPRGVRVPVAHAGGAPRRQDRAHLAGEGLRLLYTCFTPALHLLYTRRRGTWSTRSSSSRRRGLTPALHLLYTCFTPGVRIPVTHAGGAPGRQDRAHLAGEGLRLLYACFTLSLPCLLFSPAL